MPFSIGLLGPCGSHSFDAWQEILAWLKGFSHAEQFTPSELLYPGLTSCLNALHTGRVDAVLVPAENSLEGSVREVSDAVVFGSSEPLIQLEWVKPITHSLYRYGDKTLTGISHVASHPQALAQCRDHLVAALNADIQWHPSTSTAEAMAWLMSEKNPHYVAIASGNARQHYPQLHCVMADACGVPDNQTRFWLLSPKPLQLPLTASTSLKTSLCLSLKSNEAGALLELLTVVAQYKLNMARIMSRPAKTRLGEYIFFIDFEGPRPPESFFQALQPLCDLFQPLGTYPVVESPSTVETT
jgi:prephenate dehydratase